jgi:outer membrane protein TolC
MRTVKAIFGGLQIPPFACLGFGMLLMAAPAGTLRAQNRDAPPPDLKKSGESYVLDLATALRLANARNLDIQIAQQNLALARANHEAAQAQFFPWLAPGIVYRRHDDLIQDVSGNLFDVHKQSYAPGIMLVAQVDIGDALYKSLAAKQQAEAALHNTEAQRQAGVYAAARDYFDLLFAQASVNVAREAVQISTNYQAQVAEAVQAGLAFKGDELRVSFEREHNELLLRQALQNERTASAQLAQTLHLDPALELQAVSEELVPLIEVETNSPLSSMVSQALETRPETAQARASVASARATRSGAVYGPLIPTAGAQIFVGGLGGDSSAGPSRFGNQEDYVLGLSWRIGPGGLLDFTRRRAADAQLHGAELTWEKLEDEIARQVVDAATRVQSQRDQIQSARRALRTAEEGLRLAQLRREFAVGLVLENIQAARDLTRAHFDYLQAVAEFNSAQYALKRALGHL